MYRDHLCSCLRARRRARRRQLRRGNIRRRERGSSHICDRTLCEMQPAQRYRERALGNLHWRHACQLRHWIIQRGAGVPELSNVRRFDRADGDGIRSRRKFRRGVHSVGVNGPESRISACNSVDRPVYRRLGPVTRFRGELLLRATPGMDATRRCPRSTLSSAPARLLLPGRLAKSPGRTRRPATNRPVQLTSPVRNASRLLPFDFRP